MENDNEGKLHFNLKKKNIVFANFCVHFEYIDKRKY